MQGWYVKSNRQLITVSVSVSFSLLDWTQCVWFILIVSKLFNSGQQEFDISKDFHLCAFMTQYKAYGIIQSMYIRILIQYNTILTLNMKVLMAACIQWIEVCTCSIPLLELASPPDASVSALVDILLVLTDSAALTEYLSSAYMKDLQGIHQTSW